MWVPSAVLALVLVSAVLVAGAGASHNTYQQVSLGPGGGNGAFTTQWLGGSADGTRVLIRTIEPLVAADTDETFDIYQRAADGTTTLVSVGSTPVEAWYGGSSADGTKVVFETWDNPDPTDNDDCNPDNPALDACADVYLWSDGAISRVSTGPTGGNGPNYASFEDISADGSRVFFITSEQLVAADMDGQRDVYQRSGTTTSLVSTGPAGGNSEEFMPVYRGTSEDGTHAFFTTKEQLVAADTDSTGDVYERFNGTTTLLSTGAAGGNGPHAASFRGASSDGTRVFIETAESLVAGDTDSAIDVYERAGGATTLISTGSAGGNGSHDALLKAWSASGSRAFFQTQEQLTGSDTDSRVDVYERTSGATSLVSTGPAGGNGPHDALLQDVSEAGSRVVIGTAEALVAGDTDGRTDLYERFGGTTTTLLSTGPAGGNGPYDAFFSAASKDGGRVFFETNEQLNGDTDSLSDVYERQSGTTTRVSNGSTGGNGAQAAFFTGAAEDGTRVWFATAEKLASTDTDVRTDIYEARPTAAYPRPLGAAVTRVSLVVAYDQCTSPNRLHGPPAFGSGGPNPSCNPPQPASDHLTVGTPDSNGQQVKAAGVAGLTTLVGSPSTPADEADVLLHLDMNDVRQRTGLGDYAGQLQVSTTISVVDKYNGSTPVDPATMTPITFSFTAPCATTADTTVGSTCVVDTTAEAVVPGAVVEGMRAIWQLGQIEVFDGGADGVVSTTPNTTFLRQGLFIP